jgi:hypothetical protein
VHFQANVALKKKYGYQEQFYVKTEAINILGVLFSIIPFDSPIQ